MSEMRILAIEDEPRMSALLHKGLSEHGHEVTVGFTGADALKLTLDQSFEVILLDVGLPDLSGYDVAQVLKARKCPSPILMLTAYDQEDQIVRGLNLGADDYLTKPFSFPELLARLRSVTRSLPEPPTSRFTVADLTVDLQQRKVTRRGRTIDLTRTEFVLLERLLWHAPQVAPRSSLIEGVWGNANEVTPGALDVLVNALRGKIDAHYPLKLLHTVRGIGYQFAAGSLTE